MTWSVTVAAIVERQGRFLVVEETDGVHPERVLNQPAGHLEPGESLREAVIRETREETGLPFEPQAFLGIYQLQARNGHDYLRVAFVGTVPETLEAKSQDPQILACHWLGREEIARRPRSGIVLRCIDDYLDRHRFPLSAVEHLLRER
jgi:8-oxo-dGTP pyrophosphatase MutT (NUDIX family)